MDYVRFMGTPATARYLVIKLMTDFDPSQHVSVDKVPDPQAVMGFMERLGFDYMPAYHTPDMDGPQAVFMKSQGVPENIVLPADQLFQVPWRQVLEKVGWATPTATQSPPEVPHA